MANRATVTYNGKTISTEDKDGSFAVTYNGSTLATLGAGQSKTLNCSGQPMKSDIVVGGKTLRCKSLKMHSDVVVSVVSLFPPNPSGYDLIGRYTYSQTWRAPEDGWYQIEDFGASGSGGNYAVKENVIPGLFDTVYSGGGGGGGGYACSKNVPLKKGDPVVITIGTAGQATTVEINSSYDNSFDHTLEVRSGQNGKNGPGNLDADGNGTSGGEGGEGGEAFGGRYSNIKGSKGENGVEGAKNAYVAGEYGVYPDGGEGGDGANGAPKGGKGGGHPGTKDGIYYDPVGGSPGFVKIYRGNTN